MWNINSHKSYSAQVSHCWEDPKKTYMLWSDSQVWIHPELLSWPCTWSEAPLMIWRCTTFIWIPSLITYHILSAFTHSKSSWVFHCSKHYGRTKFTYPFCQKCTDCLIFINSQQISGFCTDTFEPKGLFYHPH